MSYLAPRDRYYILKDDGTPVKCSLQEWMEFKTTYGNCHVGLTHFDPKGSVSTVFLGMDHNFKLDDSDYRPYIFETYVGSGQGEGGDVVERYATYQEAKEGHAKWVAELARKLNQSVPQIEAPILFLPPT